MREGRLGFADPQTFHHVGQDGGIGEAPDADSDGKRQKASENQHGRMSVTHGQLALPDHHALPLPYVAAEVAV